MSTLVPLTISVIGGTAFVFRQLKLDKAFLDVRILANRNYTVAVAGSMVLYLVMMGGSVLMPLYVQSALEFSAIVSALVTLPGSVATALISPFAGRLYDRFGIRKLFVIGSLALLASTVGMIFVVRETPLAVAIVLNVIRSISIGCLMMPLLTWGTSQIAPRKVPDASSLLTSLRTVSGSIGSAFFVGIMTFASANTVAIFCDDDSIRGVNAAFFAMSVTSLLLVALAVFGPGKAKPC